MRGYFPKEEIDLRFKDKDFYFVFLEKISRRSNITVEDVHRIAGAYLKGNDDVAKCFEDFFKLLRDCPNLVNDDMNKVYVSNDLDLFGSPFKVLGRERRFSLNMDAYLGNAARNVASEYFLQLLDGRPNLEGYVEMREEHVCFLAAFRAYQNYNKKRDNAFDNGCLNLPQVVGKKFVEKFSQIRLPASKETTRIYFYAIDGLGISCNWDLISNYEYTDGRLKEEVLTALKKTKPEYFE